MSRLEEFRRFRERMNEKILEADNLEIRRFFRLDGQVYENGALDTRTKELMGLTASMGAVTISHACPMPSSVGLEVTMP